MNEVGFEILVRTLVPQLPPSYPHELYVEIVCLVCRAETGNWSTF